jgi:cyclic dehypoxanthinyl futalosine synthase
MAKIDSILERALNGERLGLEDGIALWESDEIEKMGSVANQLMLRRHPEPITTFIIGRNVNYSNVCDTYCRFCAFYRRPGHEEGYVLSNEEVFQKIQETVDVGGTEILMQGGTNPDLPFSYYTNLLREIKKRLSGLSIKEVIQELKDAGLDSIPGGGAEILDDRIRMKISRLKGSWRQWMDVMQTAHRLGMSTTATMVIGFGETIEERIKHLLRIRQAQDETKGFLAFIVWTFQPDNTYLKREKLPAEEYLKAVAICRIMLDNIENFQSSWVTMGPEIGKLSLHYGCNDFGSTMIEENVVSAAGTAHKVNNNLAIQLIREAGKIPAQRNTKYEILRVFHEGEMAEKDFIMQN